MKNESQDIAHAIKNLEHEVSELKSQVGIMRLEVKTAGMQGKSNGQGFDLILRELEKVALKFDLFTAESRLNKPGTDPYEKDR